VRREPSAPAGDAQYPRTHSVSDSMPDAVTASWINPLISGAAALLGVAIGAALNVYAEGKRRRADFTARQLRDFYGPLLGLRSAIRAHSELRVKLQDAQDAAWAQVVEQARQDGGIGAIQKLREGPLGQKFSGMIDEETRQFREVILPWYKKMVEVFRDNISLAEPETRSHFAVLIQFVEVWERFLDGKIPGQVTQELGHTEAKLHPLYDNIERTHDRLRRSLEG
jgi:hypothetical protein